MFALDYKAGVPTRGDLVALSGFDLAVVMEQDQNGYSTKVVTIRKDGKRKISHYLSEALYGPQQERLASLIRFYDACAEFHDGSKIEGGDSEIETLITGARPKAFELLRDAATAVREFDNPTNYSRARVSLDFATRTGADDIEIEQCRADLNAAKEASRAQLDLARYYQKMREAGYEPTVHCRDGGFAISFKVSGTLARPSEADEVEEVDIDFDLRRDYTRSVWEARPASDLPTQFQHVPLGV